MLIGFFDSGVGGITVLHNALQELPNADYIYYADTENVPYGPKTVAQVKEYVMDAAEFIIGRGVDVLVVACNTATSVAIDDLRRKYKIPIIGMEPAVKPAVENHKDKRILVTATALALKLDKLKKLITKLDCEDIVDLLPLPGLVRFAEDGAFGDKKVLPYLREELAPFDMKEYQTVVLGCTHFIYFRRAFRSLLGGEIELIDGNRGTVTRLVKTLQELNAPMDGSGKITWYQSGVEVKDEAALGNFAALLKRLDEA
jgi:glutamate racemase